MKLEKCFRFCSTSPVCTRSKCNAKSFICMTFRFMKEYFDLRFFCKSKQKVLQSNLCNRMSYYKNKIRNPFEPVVMLSYVLRKSGTNIKTMSNCCSWKPVYWQIKTTAHVPPSNVILELQQVISLTWFSV